MDVFYFDPRLRILGSFSLAPSGIRHDLYLSPKRVTHFKKSQLKIIISQREPVEQSNRFPSDCDYLFLNVLFVTKVF